VTTRRSEPVDEFVLAYDDVGSGPAVVLLHGWPGDRGDYRLLVPLLRNRARIVVPDLRGFGESDKHDADPTEHYDAAAQARSVAGLIEELELGAVVLGGYDVGSGVARALSQQRPELVRAMVLAPPMPGVGERVLEPDPQREFWYQHFHNLDLAVRLIDGNPDAVRHYLAHFWQHWSGPEFHLGDADLERLVTRYSPPGAFRASIAWYRSGASTVGRALSETAPDRADRNATLLTVLWPEHDPLFPRDWSDGVDRFFSHAEVRAVDGVGHFAPLEYPEQMAEPITAALPN
jgi:pimeloyl-ACP methyl ester carboxylesterase